MSTPAPVTYEVTSVAPDTDFSTAGTQIPGKRVTITTSTGYTGTVFIPSSVLTDLPRVVALIEDEVRKVAAVQGIKGSVAGS